ncbi:hypothetical protein BDQ17DRAFT_1407044 [Cyathus striatus]|nr:hypothetical protein BDQ17DRAFT_1407044 [Cyathus striatus]
MSDHPMDTSDTDVDARLRPQVQGDIDVDALVALISKTFDTVCEEFDEWNEEYCRQALESLRQPLGVTPSQVELQQTLIISPSIASSSTSQSSSNENTSLPMRYSMRARQTTNTSTAKPTPPQTVDDYGSGDDFLIEEYDPDRPGESPISTTTVRAITVEVPQVAPYPYYETTTPLMSNIMVGDDSHYMPFIPYTDDEDFMENHFDQYRSRFKYFEWTDIRERDPDMELIVLETAGRLLYTDLGLPPSIARPITLEDIDAANVLPLKLLPVEDKNLAPGREGVLKACQRRDFPSWPPNPSPVPSVSKISTRPKEILEGLSKCFCNNLNCIVGFCQLHVNEMPIPNAVAPTLSMESILRSIEKECGPECCLRGPAAARSIPTDWSENDHELLEMVLKYDPDAVPCDLAVICRKPCYEIQKYREQNLTPSVPLGRGTKRNASARSGNYHDYDSREFVPNDPCSHTGPCSPAFNCQCYQNAAHCSSACRCSKTCPRRLFCSCTKTKKGNACTSDKCPCMRAKRECDPELCVRCSCRDAEANVCQNAQLQQGVKKHTEVRPSDWGLGLFIQEPAKTGDLISEYIGELICDSTMISRNDIYRYTGRCYLFELNKTYTIDSAVAGNETRYINHSKDPNCEARVMMVNGEHRIGMYALKSIEPGAELLFDYGGVFFISEQDPSQSQEEEITRKGRKRRTKANREEPTTDSGLKYQDRTSDEDYATENKMDSVSD